MGRGLFVSFFHMLQKNHTHHLSSTVWLWLLLSCLSISLVSTVSHAQAAESLLDTDGDGIPDLWEVQVYRTDPTLFDTDGDGYGDREEIERGFNPLGNGGLAEADMDRDGLSDRLELLFQTDPTKADSDGDTFLDGIEVTNGFSPTSTERVLLEKSIAIHLNTQRLETRVMNIPIKSYLVSTGLPRTPTPVGTFKVLSKHPRAWSSSAKLWMPYWMQFTHRGHGLHELPEWPGGRKEGANHLGRVASHGCVRLGVGSAKELYDWTPVGTKITVIKPPVVKKTAPIAKK